MQPFFEQVYNLKTTISGKVFRNFPKYFIKIKISKIAFLLEDIIKL